MNRLVELTAKEYLDRKLDAAKEILSVLVTQYPPEFISDKKKRASIIFNSVSVSGDLLKEVGFILEGESVQGGDEEEATAIMKLDDLLKEDE